MIEIVKPAAVTFAKTCRLSAEAKAKYIIEHSIVGEGETYTNAMIGSIADALEELEEIEPTRTVAEVETICKCIRQGIPVQIEYVIPENPGKDVSCW